MLHLHILCRMCHHTFTLVTPPLPLLLSHSSPSQLWVRENRYAHTGCQESQVNAFHWTTSKTNLQVGLGNPISAGTDISDWMIQIQSWSYMAPMACPTGPHLPCRRWGLGASQSNAFFQYTCPHPWCLSRLIHAGNFHAWWLASCMCKCVPSQIPVAFCLRYHILLISWKCICPSQGDSHPP